MYLISMRFQVLMTVTVLWLYSDKGQWLSTRERSCQRLGPLVQFLATHPLALVAVCQSLSTYRCQVRLMDRTRYMHCKRTLYRIRMIGDELRIINMYRNYVSWTYLAGTCKVIKGERNGATSVGSPVLHNVQQSVYRLFQKSLYRKARYKNHLPLKYCITKMELKAALARHVC
jgi:hypothetical protein